MIRPGPFLREVVARGIGVERDPDDGRPVLVDPDDRMTDAGLLHAYWYRWLFEVALAGSVTGHRWYGCDSCGELQLRHAIKANNGRPCRLTPGCKGSLSLIPLEVPKRPRRPKVKVDRVPLGLEKLPADAPRSKTKSRSQHPRAARAGDSVTFLECGQHRGPRWVRTSSVPDWTCRRQVEGDGGEPVECGLPAVVLGAGVVAEVGVLSSIGEPESPDSLLPQLRSSIEDARNRKEQPCSRPGVMAT